MTRQKCMEQKSWTAVEEYLNAQLIGSNPVLGAALAANAEAQLPAADVAPNQMGALDGLDITSR